MDLNNANVKSTSTRSDGRYERFLAKAEGYLHKYQDSHSSPATGTPVAINGDNGNRTRHIEFFKKAQGYLKKKDKEDKKDKKDKNDKKDKKDGGDHHEGDHENSSSENEGQHDHKEHLKLAHAMLKKIKKHKERHGKQNEEEQVEEKAEIEEEEEEEEEGGWFTELMEGVQEFVEGLNEE